MTRRGTWSGLAWIEAARVSMCPHEPSLLSKLTLGWAMLCVRWGRSQLASRTAASGTPSSATGRAYVTPLSRPAPCSPQPAPHALDPCPAPCTESLAPVLWSLGNRWPLQAAPAGRPRPRCGAPDARHRPDGPHAHLRISGAAAGHGRRGTSQLARPHRRPAPVPSHPRHTLGPCPPARATCATSAS